MMSAALVACATTGEQRPQPGGAVGAYPSWLITLAEPVAPEIGYTISLVQWREGYVHRHDEAIRRVRSMLRPLDILLFSNKGRLSGHTGAGLFGHSAVYLGNESELKALGLWNDAALAPYREAIKSGRTIVESAQKHGSQLSTLERVIDTDRVVLLRPRDRGAAWRKRTIRGYFGSVGSPFDHHFRLDDSTAVFCTELIDVNQPELDLPRRVAYGREVILPDDIARMAIAGRRGLTLRLYLRADAKGFEAAGARALAADIAGFDQ